MQMLLQWKQKKAGRATVDQLIKHLINLQQAGLAEKLAERLEIEIDMTITAEPEQPKKNKSRTKHGSKQGRGSSKRGQAVTAKTKREYFSQSSGFSSENGCPSSPDSEEPRSNGQGIIRTSESSEGYQSSGSRKIKSKPRHSKDRPHVKIPKGTPPEVDITKDQVPKRTSSRLRQQLQQHNQNGVEQQPIKLTSATCAFGSNGSCGSANSDLIVSEGGSDVAEESDVDEQDEVVTSTMLDCGDPESTATDTEECSSIEPTSPDSLIHQTVPKILDESYTLEHVNV